MPSLPWFRFYREAVDDEKLRLLAFEDRWHFVALLCCKASGILDGDNIGMTRRKLCVKLGVDGVTFDEIIRRLSEVGLIDRATFQPTKWDERQFESDTSRNRTKAYRDRMNAKRHGDVTVTAQEADTETDTEAEKKTTSRFAEFWSAWPAHPRKANRKKCEAHWVKHQLDQQADAIIAHVNACRTSAAWIKQAGEFIPAPMVYLGQERYEAPAAQPAQAAQSTHTGFETRDYREGIADDGSFT